MKIKTTDITSYGVGFEPTIAPGTTSQYWRGDKTWQTLPAPGISDAPSDGKTYGRLNAAWTDLNLTQYAQLSGAAFTGNISAINATFSSITTTTNSAALTMKGTSPFIVWYDPTGVTQYGYIQHTGSGNNLIISNNMNGRFDFNVGGSSALSMNTTGTTFFTRATALALAIDTNFYSTLISSKPTIFFDTGDYLQYDRSANKLYLYIGNTAVLSVDASGNVRAAGSITPNVTP